MPDIDLDRLDEDVRRLLPAGHENARRPVKELYLSRKLEQRTIFAMADSAAEAIQIRQLTLAFWGAVVGQLLSINRSAATGDEKTRKAAGEAIKSMKKTMREGPDWMSELTPLSFLYDSLERAGYQPSPFELECLAFARTWGPKMQPLVSRTSTTHPDSEVQLYAALLGMDVGRLIKPFDLMMSKPILAPAVAEASEVMLAMIEERGHAWRLTNLVTGGCARRLLQIMTDNEGMNLYPMLSETSVSKLISAVAIADRADADISDMVSSGSSVFEQSVRVEQGESAVEVVSRVVETIVAEDAGSRLRKVIVMDDDGKAVTLEEFFRARGEELPDHVREAIAGDDSGEG